MLNEHEKRIVKSLLHAWDEGDQALPGDISYKCLFDFLDKNGIERPPKITEFIRKIEAGEPPYNDVEDELFDAYRG